MPEPFPVPDMLTQGRCTKGGGDWNPACVATSCCCLDKLCVKALPQEIIQIAGVTQVSCPVKFDRHFHHIDDAGKPCSMKMNEFDLGTSRMVTGRDPRGYAKWNESDWNNAEANVDWPLAITECNNAQSAYEGTSSMTDYIHMGMGVQFVQLLEVKSGCEASGCLDCCVMLFSKVVENNDAPECSIDVRAKCAPSGRLSCGLPSVKPWPGSPYKNEYFTPEELHRQSTHGDEWTRLDITKKDNGVVVGGCMS